MQEIHHRYLQLLGFDQAPEGLKGLRQLVRAHILRVPFENVSKLLLFDREHKGRQTTLAEFLDGVEGQDLGGTCYTSNPFFAELLREIGYEAVLMSCDMNSPNVHTSIRVRINEAAYHVDVGNAAPFLEPIAVNRLPYETGRGTMCWVFDRADDGRLECRVYSGKDHVHGYRVNEMPHQLDFFRSIVEDSFLPGRTFMSLLRMVRIFAEHTVELKDRTVRVHRGDETTERTIGSLEELRRTVDEEFLMPRCPVERAVKILEDVNQMDFFSRPANASLYA